MHGSNNVLRKIEIGVRGKLQSVIETKINISYFNYFKTSL